MCLLFYGALITSLSYSYIGVTLNDDEYFHILSLTPYGNLSIIRALSSLHFIPSGVWCLYLFCLFVCLFYSHSVAGYYRYRLENFTFLILLF